MTKACENCGAVFELRRGYPQQRYCGVTCASVAARSAGKFRGANNPRWAGGVSADKVRYRERFEERFPGKAAAHRAVKNALRSGKLARANCEACGAAGAEAHHDDYSKPLEVRWLCRSCHHRWHEENAPARAPGGDPTIPIAAVPPVRDGGDFVWRGKLRTR